MNIFGTEKYKRKLVLFLNISSGKRPRRSKLDFKKVWEKFPINAMRKFTTEAERKTSLNSKLKRRMKIGSLRATDSRYYTHSFASFYLLRFKSPVL